MTKQMCLTQDDIRQIIANAFSVEKDNVDLDPYKDLEGYGPGEHYVMKVRATVELPINNEEASKVRTVPGRLDCNDDIIMMNFNGDNI